MKKKATESYMEMCLNLDGKENLYLRIPTVWDDIEKQWIGFIKTPITQRLISGNGKTSLDLQNSFNRAMSEEFKKGGEVAEELYAMFMPAFYYEDK